MTAFRWPVWLVLAALACRGDSSKVAARVATPSARAVAATPCGGPIFDGDGIGALRIGATVDSVRAACDVVRDTVELRAEGMPARILSVALMGDTLEAEVVDDRVWRISVERPRFQTSDSLGVGIPTARLLSLPDVRGLTGEGALYLVSPARCGLSFRVSNPAIDPPPSKWTIAALRRLPATSVVTEVLILGCQPPPVSANNRSAAAVYVNRPSPAARTVPSSARPSIPVL